MAVTSLLVGAIGTAVSTGLQLLFAPTPKKQRVGGQDPQLPKYGYGSEIPIIYGKSKLATTWIFPNKKDVMYRQETTTESSGGGKGGGGSNKTEKTETFATFACLICEGEVELDSIIIKDTKYNTSSDVFQKYCTFFDGTQTQPWSVIQNKDDNPKNQIVYKDLAYIGFEDLPSEYFDFKVDAIVESVAFPENPDLGEVVFDLCDRMINILVERNKIDANFINRIDATELNGIKIQRGIIVNRSSEGYREILEQLATIYLFTVCELPDGTIKFKKFQRDINEPILTVPPEHFFPIENGDDYNIYSRKPSPKEGEGIPREIIFSYIYSGRYVPDKVKEFFSFGEENNTLKLSSSLVSEPKLVRGLIFNQQKFLAVWQRNIYEFVIPAFYYNQIELLGLINLPNGETVQAYAINTGNDYFLRITASSYGGELGLEYNNPNDDDIGQDDDYIKPTIPNVYILDIPQIEDYPPSTLYVLATAPNNLLISLDGGITTKTTVNHLAVSTIGNCLTSLPNVTGLDTVNTLDIQLESGFVEGISKAQFDNPDLFNLALLAVQSPSGYWSGKFIQFRDVSALGNNQYRLSYLFQGWFGTQSFDTSGLPLKFFLLKGNGSYYSTIQGNPEFIGQTITTTPVVSSAQDTGSTPPTTFTPIGNGYKPNPVTNIDAQEDFDGNFLFTWDYQANLSSYNSNSKPEDITFEIDINGTSRTLTTNTTQVIYGRSLVEQDAVTKPYEITVYAVNSVVGRGDGVVYLVNPTPIPDLIFGTGDGLDGVKIITSNYIVQEEDNSRILLGITADLAEYTVTFPSTLSNGFQCILINSIDSNNASFFTVVADNTITRDENNRIKAGDSRQIQHTSQGSYFVIGKNRILYDYGDIPTQPLGAIVSNIYYNLPTPGLNIPMPSSPIEGDIIAFKTAQTGDYINNPITLTGSTVEGVTDFQITENDIRYQFYFNGTEWIYLSKTDNQIIADILQDIADLNLNADEIETDIDSIQQQLQSFLTSSEILDLVETFLVAGENITIIRDQGSLIISSVGGGGGSGSGGGLATDYIQGSLVNTSRVDLAINKSVYAIKVFNPSGSQQDVRIVSTINGTPQSLIAYSLPNNQDVNFKFPYALNYVNPNDGLAIECSLGGVSYYCEFGEANSDIAVQGVVANSTQTAIYTATATVTIPLIMLINLDVTQANQEITLFVRKNGIILQREPTKTLVSGQTWDISPDSSITLDAGEEILLDCSVGSMGYTIVSFVQ